MVPQVGNILRRVEAARGTVYPLPLDICGAHSQGGIGYILQREINNVFRGREIDKIAYTVITHAWWTRKILPFKTQRNR